MRFFTHTISVLWGVNFLLSLALQNWNEAFLTFVIVWYAVGKSIDYETEEHSN